MSSGSLPKPAHAAETSAAASADSESLATAVLRPALWHAPAMLQSRAHPLQAAQASPLPVLKVGLPDPDQHGHVLPARGPEGGEDSNEPSTTF